MSCLAGSYIDLSMLQPCSQSDSLASGWSMPFFLAQSNCTVQALVQSRAVTCSLLGGPAPGSEVLGEDEEEAGFFSSSFFPQEATSSDRPREQMSTLIMPE